MQDAHAETADSGQSDDQSADATERQEVGFLEVDEDDSLEGVGLVAKDESGQLIRGPSMTGPGRYVLIREDVAGTNESGDKSLVEDY